MKPEPMFMLGMKVVMMLVMTLSYFLGCDAEGSAMFPILSRRSTGMQRGLRRGLCGEVLVHRCLARRSRGDGFGVVLARF